MKLYESEHIFDYNWDQVSAANWLKYPNEKSSHVVAVDVLKREFDNNTQTLRSERLITCEQSIPNWMKAIIGTNRSYVREISEVNAINKTLIMRSVNLTCNDYLKVYEIVKYTPFEDDLLNKTKFEQIAEITAYASFKKLTEKIENWSIERFDTNAALGRQGFETVLDLFGQVNDMTDKALGEVNGVIDGVKKKIDELKG